MFLPCETWHAGSYVSQASAPLVPALALTNILLQGFPWQGTGDRPASVSKPNREALQGRTDGWGRHAKTLKLNNFVTPKTLCCWTEISNLHASVLTDVRPLMQELHFTPFQFFARFVSSDKHSPPRYILFMPQGNNVQRIKNNMISVEQILGENKQHAHLKS